MRRDKRGIHIIGRMLHRREPVDVHPFRKHDDAARVLSGRPADTHAAGRQSLDLTAFFCLPDVLKIMQGVAVSCFVRHGTDRPGLEGLPLAEYHFRIGLGNPLLIAGEIEVYVRLLVTLEAKESLKRNVKTVLQQLFPADRADTVRHVAAAAPVQMGLNRLFRVKVAVQAFGAAVMGRQRIHFRDPRHRRRKRRTDRAPRTHQIAVLIGFVHQLLGDDIHDGVSVLNNGIQFFVQPLLDRRRQRIPVHRMRRLITHVMQVLFRVGDLRRAFVRIDRRNLLNPVRNQVRVGDHDFAAFFIAEVGKFRQHLLRRPEIKRGLLLRLILIPVPGLNDGAVNPVLRIQEMHIAGRAHRLPEFLPETHDPAVDLPQVLHVLYAVPLFPDHIHVVSVRLDLEIIIVIHDPGYFRVGSSAQDGFIQLSRRAGAPEDEALAVSI